MFKSEISSNLPQEMLVLRLLNQDLLLYP